MRGNSKDSQDANELVLALLLALILVGIMIFGFCQLFDDICDSCNIDPCEQANRGNQITGNGEFIGCTGDGTYYRG